MGAVYRDLLHHYGVDLVEVVQGRGPHPALVFSLIEGLPTDNSLIYAARLGGVEHFGWGIQAHMAANLFDAMQLNTRVSGNWKKGKAPDLPMAHRPGSKTKKKKRPVGSKGTAKVTDALSVWRGGRP